MTKGNICKPFRGATIVKVNIKKTGKEMFSQKKLAIVPFTIYNGQIIFPSTDQSIRTKRNKHRAHSKDGGGGPVRPAVRVP